MCTNHKHTFTLTHPRGLCQKRQDFLLSEETFNRLKLVSFLSGSIIKANQTGLRSNRLGLRVGSKSNFNQTNQLSQKK